MDRTKGIGGTDLIVDLRTNKEITIRSGKDNNNIAVITFDKDYSISNDEKLEIITELIVSI